MPSPVEVVLARYRNHPEFLGVELTDVNQRGALGDTPLHIASRNGNVVDARLLIQFGADVNSSGDVGNTPLHFASMTGMLEIVRLLIMAGANTSKLNEFFQSALDVAELGGHDAVAKVLKGSL